MITPMADGSLGYTMMVTMLFKDADGVREFMQQRYDRYCGGPANIIMFRQTPGSKDKPIPTYESFAKCAADEQKQP